MSENDPDPYLPDEGQGRAELGGRDEPAAGDPTDGGPALGPGGGRVAEDTDAAPVADPGPDA